MLDSLCSCILNKELLKVRSRALLYTLLFVYLVVGRIGSLVSNSGLEQFNSKHLQLTLLFQDIIRAPEPLISCTVRPCVQGSVMGNCSCFSGDSYHRPSPSPQPDEQRKSSPVPVETGSAQDAVCSDASVNGLGTENNPVRFSEVEDSISTGDLAVLYRGENQIPHYAVFIKDRQSGSNLPLLLLKGKTKPLPIEKFNRSVPRNAHTVSATTRIFYGDCRKVAIHTLLPGSQINIKRVISAIDELSMIPFTDEEVEAITNARTPEERSAILCTFMVAYFYNRIGMLEADPNTITPANLVGSLELSEPTYIKLPKVREGPMASGDPPFLAKLVNGIMPPPEVDAVPFSSIQHKLQTGDLVLFSGATSSGAIIKLFDNSQFSHVGLVLKSEYVSQLLVWEASTNKAGLVDISSGKVREGVELLPLTHKIFSGWYDLVAIRRLTGIDSTQRAQMCQDLLAFRKEVEGRPYEQDKTELILSTIDFQDKYLSFLRNTEEDLSSLFCSELVAEAYKRMGLLDDRKLSNTYTPDDFASSHLQLQFGELEPEIYIELKFDFGFERQTSVF